MTRALLALVLLAGAAHGGTVVEIPKAKARLELPDGWTKTEAPQLAAAYKHSGGAVLVVVRTDVPNRDAWSKDAKTRQAHADAIERGIRKSVPGYRRTKRALGDAGAVPVLDVEAARDGGATVIVRVLLFRTYSLSLALEAPKRGDVAVARAIAATFAPVESGS